MKHTVSVEIELSPLVIARAFAQMGSDEQAETLGRIWRALEESCGSDSRREMQCVYIKEAIAQDGDALLLLAELQEEADPMGQLGAMAVIQPAASTCTIERAETMDCVVITLTQAGLVAKTRVTDLELACTASPDLLLQRQAEVAALKFPDPPALDEPIREAVTRFRDRCSIERKTEETVAADKRRPCPECNGTGEYIHLNNKRSPCSMGCR